MGPVGGDGGSPSPEASTASLSCAIAPPHPPPRPWRRKNLERAPCGHLWPWPRFQPGLCWALTWAAEVGTAWDGTVGGAADVIGCPVHRVALALGQ